MAELEHIVEDFLKIIKIKILSELIAPRTVKWN